SLSSLLDALPIWLGSPPELLLHVLHDLLVGPRPQTGREVLPAAVCQQADDVAGLDALCRTLRRSHDRAAGDAGEDARALREVLRHRERGGGIDDDPAIQDGVVEDRRDVPLLE